MKWKTNAIKKINKQNVVCKIDKPLGRSGQKETEDKNDQYQGHG